MNLAGSVNYRDRSLSEPLVPDDLDDTALAFTAITIHSPKILTDQMLLSFIKILVENETQEGGPYYTWVVPKNIREDWNDVDPVVNMNIFRFLGMHDIHLESLERFLENIVTHDLRSKYYSALHINFFLSKWNHSTNQKQRLKKLANLYPQIVTSLDRALFITSYLNLNGDPNKISYDVKKISRLKLSDIDYDPFYIEEKDGESITYAGSKPLTVAHIVQALHLYEQSQEVSRSVYHSSNENKLVQQVSQAVTKTIPCDTPKLHQQLSVATKKLERQPKAYEVFLLPLLWHRSLKKKYCGTFTESELISLCVVNVLGWIGFSIYDSIMDNEKKNTLLPLANICTRKIPLLTAKLSLEKHSCDTIYQILNQIDLASLHEYENLKIPIHQGTIELPDKLPNYDNMKHLAHKSLGHAIGPIVITPSKQAYIEDFFINYLISRQLNDDAHDWFEDLKNGHLNPVSVKVLKQYLTFTPHVKNINLKLEQEVLRSIYWHKTIDIIAAEIRYHAKLAREIAQKLNIFENQNLIERLLRPLEQSADQAITERNRMTKFLENYH
jgi:hypothetical protein